MPIVRVVHQPDRRRYQILIDDEEAGFTTYQPRGAQTAFVHTEIDPRFAGEGRGTQLIREALDDVDAHGGSVLPYCPFVRSFIAHNPEYLHLVPEASRPAFDLPAADGR